MERVVVNVLVGKAKTALDKVKQASKILFKAIVVRGEKPELRN